MIQGTTPAVTLTIPNSGDLDLTGADSVSVTLKQGFRTVTKQGEDLEIEPKSVTFRLTQEESLGFTEGRAEVQLNWLSPDPGDGVSCRGATRAKEIEIGRQLLTEVM